MFGWTAFFTIGCRWSDPSQPTRLLAQALGTMTLRACATSEAAPYQGVILQVYATEREGADRYGQI